MKFTYKHPLNKSSLPEKFEEHAKVFVTSFLKEKGEPVEGDFFCNIEKVYTPLYVKIVVA